MTTFTYIGIIIVAACTGAFIWLFLWRGRDKDDVWDGLTDLGIPKDHAMWKHEYTTQRGVSIRSVAALVLNSIFDTVDLGIRTTILRWRLKFPEWTKAIAHSDYRLLFVEPQRTNRDGSPAVLVKGIQSAGTTIGLGPAPITERPYLVIPHQAASHWRYRDYLRDSVANESDHYIAGCNDLVVFYWFLGRRDIHPHDLDSYPGRAEALRILAEEGGVLLPTNLTDDGLLETPERVNEILAGVHKHLERTNQLICTGSKEKEN